jgi:hypothetical protein
LEEFVFYLQELTFTLFLGDNCGITPNPTFNEVFGFVRNEGKLECTRILKGGNSDKDANLASQVMKANLKTITFLKSKPTYKSTLELSLRINQNQPSLPILQIKCSYKD